jgi:hypothetical protein
MRVLLALALLAAPAAAVPSGERRTDGASGDGVPRAAAPSGERRTDGASGDGVPRAAAPAKKKAARHPPTAAQLLVELFLTTPTADLPPERVEEFLAVDPSSLPAGMRPGCLGKKEELRALKKIAGGRMKPPVRRVDMPSPAEKDCQALEGERGIGIMKMAGFTSLEETEVQFSTEQTQCTECEMMVEFTLQKVVVKPTGKAAKKGEVPKAYYFLHPKDPLWNLVAVYRDGRKNAFGTNFFGVGTPTCR